MRHIFTTLIILSGIATASAQELSYGLKAGTNFANGGLITGESHREDGNLVYWTGSSQGETKAGFHGGGFVEMAFGNFFLRPEIVYTSIQSEFTFPYKTSIYKVERLDIPLLFGYNILDMAGLYAGPVYSPLFENELQYKEATIVKQDELVWLEGSSLNDPALPVNLQIGLKSEFSNFGIDLRYEHNLSGPSPERVDMLNSRVGREEGGINVATVEDSALSQVILSLTYKFSSSSGSNGRRGGYSYSRRRRTR